MQDYDFEVAVKLQMSLGECPLWSVSRQCLHWVDINRGQLFTWRPEDGDTPDTMEIDEPVGCITLTADGLLAAAASGIQEIAFPKGSRKPVATNPEWNGGKGNRFNDGRCDARGRLWIGTIDAHEVSPSAALYCLTAQGLIRKKADLVISNGLAFSPDRQWMYHTDSMTRRVVRHRFQEESATLGEAEPWIDLADHDLPGVPDGAAVDSEGNYWCALYGGGQVAKFASDGSWVRSYFLPSPHPTMVAFGGSDLGTLYVTTATQHLDEKDKQRWPLAGSIFAMAAPNQGLEEPGFLPM
ncbi:CBU_1789 family Dot/Icm type IV secretion system effector [Halomonas shantousis]